jgi:hypothetical protein
MHDDNDDEIRRQNYERMFGTPEEREAEASEAEVRAARIRSEETLAWARQRAEEREAERQRAPVVEKTHAAQAKATQYWEGYIKQQLDKRDLSMIKAIAQAVVDEERRRERADADIKTIIFDVRDRFDAMEVRAFEVEALRTAIDELREKIDKLEASDKATPIRLVG